MKSNGWSEGTAAFQLFAHLDGEALNVALLMPEEEQEKWEGLSNGLSEYYNSPETSCVPAAIQERDSPAGSGSGYVRHRAGNPRSAGIWGHGYESVLVPHSSLKCNSKFPVGMSKFPVQTRNFQLGCRNFQFKLEISSRTKWKFPIRTRNFQLDCRNFQFEEVEISSSNSKFPVQTRNFRLDKVEISSWNSKFPVGMSKFPV